MVKNSKIKLQYLNSHVKQIINLWHGIYILLQPQMPKGGVANSLFKFILPIYFEF